MSSSIRTITPTHVRQLAITRQHLAGKPPRPDADYMLNVIRDLGCLQLDPISAVSRSHTLVLWSRLGTYNLTDLNKLLWQDRSLFEYWAHAASIVLMEDYPVHYHQMQHYRNAESHWGIRARQWASENQTLHDNILAEITSNGPLPSKVFVDSSQARWQSTGWTGDRNVNQMLGYLWNTGTIMVAGRNKGGHRVWDLTERCLPDWTPRDGLTEGEVVYRAAQKSLRALGVAQLKEIQQHYVRGRYPALPQVLRELESNHQIEQVQIVEEGNPWPGTWYIHTNDLPLLDQLEYGDFEPRTTLLSPFDNLICDRTRTEKLFDFEFRIEIYVPKARRKYGYYVLPILHGDKLIGRIDPLMDRKQKRLNINAVYAEPEAPMNKQTGAAVASAIQDLAGFLGAGDIVYTDHVPAGWKTALR